MHDGGLAEEAVRDAREVEAQYRQALGDLVRCGEIWGDVGRYSEVEAQYRQALGDLVRVRVRVRVGVRVGVRVAVRARVRVRVRPSETAERPMYLNATLVRVIRVGLGLRAGLGL